MAGVLGGADDAVAALGALGARERAGWPEAMKRDLFTNAWNIAFVFRDLHRICRAGVQRRIAERGVPIGAWAYLWALYEEDGLAQHELARRVRLVGPSVVAAINQMERGGLVRRQRSAVDRRVVHVFLTDRGRELRETIFAAAEAGNEMALNNLTSSEINQMFALLARVRSALEPSSDRGVPADHDAAPSAASGSRRTG